MNKKWGIIAGVAVLILGIIVILLIVFSGNKTLKGQDVNVSLNCYSSLEYKEIQGKSMKTAEITNKNEDFIFSIKIDTETLGYLYRNSFEKYKEDKQNSEDITINNITGFKYYDESTDQYQIVFHVNEEETILITIEPMVKGEGTTAKDIYNMKEVQDILESIKIDKK